MLKKMMHSFLPIIFILMSIFALLLMVQFQAGLEAEKVHVIHVQAQENDATVYDEGSEKVDANLEKHPLFIKAKQALLVGDNKTAKEAYSKLLISYPSAQIFNRLGVLFAKQKLFPQALKAYNNALKYDKHYYRAYYNKALLFKEQNKLEAAKKSYQKAILYHPYHFKSHFQLALVLEKLNEWTKATHLYEKALSLSSGVNKAKVYYRLAKLSLPHDLSKARSFVESSIRLNPKSLKSHLLKISFDKDMTTKIEKLKVLTELHPNAFEPVSTLAKLYKKEKQYAKALAVYSNYLQNIPDDASTLYEMSYIYVALKKPADALSVMKNLSQRQTNSLKYKERLLDLYWRYKKVDKLEALSQNILSLDPTNIKTLKMKADFYSYSKQDKKLQNYLLSLIPVLHNEAYERLAQFYFKQKNIPQAQKMVKKVLQSDKENSSMLFLQAQCFDSLKVREKAYPIYEKLLATQTSNIPFFIAAIKNSLNLKKYDSAKIYLASYERYKPQSDTMALFKSKIFYREKSYAKALDIVNNLLQKKPTNFNFLYLKAKILSKSRQNEEAASIFSGLVERSPSNIQLRYYYAKSLKKSVQYEKALKELKHVLALEPKHKPALKLKEKINMKLRTLS